jgi:hypothetical protein
MGSGYRTFTAGEVLTASNVQDYLMDQSVMVFADSTARATNIGTANFEEGMVSYLEDSDTVEVYDGSAWASIAPASTSGLTLINTTSFSGVSSQSVNDVFSATYTHYLIIPRATHATTAVELQMRLRVAGADNTSTQYRRQRLYGNNVTAGADRVTGQTSWNQIAEIDNSGNGLSQILIVNPFAAQPTSGFATINPGKSANLDVLQVSLLNDAATSYTGFTIFPNSGNMTGAVSVYAYNV